jgi:predicted membrane protein
VVNSQANLELGGLKISELDLKALSSSVYLSLPAQPYDTIVKIEASTTSVAIKVPVDVSARILANKSISSYEIDLSRFMMIEDGHEYRSPDYETAQNRVDIHIDLAMGSVEFL